MPQSLMASREKPTKKKEDAIAFVKMRNRQWLLSHLTYQSLIDTVADYMDYDSEFSTDNPPDWIVPINEEAAKLANKFNEELTEDETALLDYIYEQINENTAICMYYVQPTELK